VSAKGRAYLAEIFASDPYREWAEKLTNKIDASKIAKAYQGEPYKQPGSH